ncbi:MAG TPA: YbjQ family protein [Solirubrobacteraceae bacterium]
MSDEERPAAGLPMTTALDLPGMEIRENLGIVYGLVVRSMGFAGSVGAAFKSLRRGEISQYTRLLEDSRRHAIDRMVENARLLDADAVVAVRFDGSEIGQQFTEIVAYGTAVKVQRLGP